MEVELKDREGGKLNRLKEREDEAEREKTMKRRKEDKEEEGD